MTQERIERARILIIDDSRDFAEMLCTLFETFPFEVEIADSGAAALEKARTFRPEIVLCDLLLDATDDGFNVARAFRADPLLRDIQLIALSGLGDEQCKIEARKAGFDLHVTKTGDIDALMRMIENLPIRNHPRS